MKKILVMVMMACLMVQGVFAERIYPSEDAYTDSSKTNSNFNNQNLRVGYDLNHGKHRSYLKFDVSGIDSSAKLKIYSVAHVGDVPINLYYVSSDSWRENSLTWNNAPEYSNLIDSQTISSSGFIEFDIGNYINENDGVLSLALVSNSESTGNLYAQFYSGEMLEESYDPYIETGSGQECNTEADENCEGCVSLLEIVNSMLDYKQGNSDLSLMEMVNIMLKYKAGEITC